MILVVGATGTVGRKVINALASNEQIQIRALSRGKSDWEGSMLPSFRRKGIDVIVGDVRSESTVERAVKGCTAIINCAGAMRALPDADLESVNIDGVANLVDAGQAAGVQRFIQLSCLGATEHATCHFFACKWDAEELIRKSKFFWTIFRPSLIFDADSSLMRILDFWVSRKPLLYVVGSGLNRFQPIAAADVASCVVKSVYDRDTVGKIYDLTGPDMIDLQALLTMVAEERELPARVLRIPSLLGVPFAGLMGKLNPTCPIDNNVMKVLTSEMIGDSKPMLDKFDLTQISMQAGIKSIEKTGEKSATKLSDSQSSQDEDREHHDAEAEHEHDEVADDEDDDKKQVRKKSRKKK